MSAVTAWDIGRKEACSRGDRTANMRGAFSIRESFNPLERALDSRIVDQPPFEKGPTEGISVHTDTLLQDYLRAGEWD